MKAHLEVAVDTVEEFYGSLPNLQNTFLEAAGPALGLLAGQQLAVRKVRGWVRWRPFVCQSGAYIVACALAAVTSTLWQTE